jgi:hypothetical protein
MRVIGALPGARLEDGHGEEVNLRFQNLRSERDGNHGTYGSHGEEKRATGSFEF